MTKRILVVDDEQQQRQVLCRFLTTVGWETLEASSAETALDMLKNQPVDAVITDMKMPGASGLDLLLHIREGSHTLPVLLITAYSSVDDAVLAMKRGATDYITKPVNLKELQTKLKKAMEHQLVVEESANLREELVQQRISETILTKNPAMQQVLSLAARAARADVPVLILGESGTGKELMARTIHGLSSRKTGPFIPVNCASLNAGVLESELFGHEKGAFTGAGSTRKGRFELAAGGTLFLDEVGDIPPETQVKLLRVLQELEIERVGGSERIPVDFRLVCATHRNLGLMIDQGSFREDLLYRLNVISLTIPPLRDRREDIPLLLEEFTETFSHEMNIPVRGFSHAAFQKLCAYRYPGNIRELKNIVQRALVLNRGDVIEQVDVGGPEPETPATDPSRNMNEAVEDMERQMIQQALHESGHVKVRAAKLLGISERNLRYKIKKYRLEDSGEDEDA